MQPNGPQVKQPELAHRGWRGPSPRRAVLKAWALQERSQLGAPSSPDRSKAGGIVWGRLPLSPWKFNGTLDLLYDGLNPRQVPFTLASRTSAACLPWTHSQLPSWWQSLINPLSHASASKVAPRYIQGKVQVPHHGVQVHCVPPAALSLPISDSVS